MALIHSTTSWDMNVSAELTFAFNFRLEPQPTVECHLHSGWVFPPPLNLSENLLKGTLRGLFPCRCQFDYDNYHSHMTKGQTYATLVLVDHFNIGNLGDTNVPTKAPASIQYVRAVRITKYSICNRFLYVQLMVMKLRSNQ